MGFHTKRLPPLSELKDRLLKDPDSLKYYIKADSLIGPSESVDYIISLSECYKEPFSENKDNRGASNKES